MFGLKNLKIGSKVLIAPSIALLFLLTLAIFANNSLTSNKNTLKEIVEVKFELYQTSSKFLSDIELYNGVLYKVFNYVTGAYDEPEINAEIKKLNDIRKVVDEDYKKLLKSVVNDKKVKNLIKDIDVNLKDYNGQITDAMNDVMNIYLDKILESDIPFTKISKDLKNINEFAYKQNNLSYELALNKIEKTRYTLYALVAVVISLLFFIIIGVTNSIKKPLSIFQDGLLDFFQYLNQEKSDAKEIQLNSSDELGSMAKIINNSISKTKIAIEKDRVLVDSAIHCANEAKKGILDVSINGDTPNPTLHELKEVINQMLFVVRENIQNAMKVLSSYTNYDYRAKIDTTHMEEGDLKALCDDINNLGHAITTMLIENKKMGVDLSTNAHKLSKGVDSLTISANNQAASLEESAAAIEEITSNMKNSSNNIVQMNNYANEVSNSVTQGEDLASKTASSMDEINEQTQAIAEAITIIDQIAFQTNILSLNAAVEAATAGEAGKGFAVVAQEVRNLASRSAEAAHEIKELVENATEKTNEGKKISTDMINGYERLNKNIHNTLSLISEVSNSSKEQFSAMEQINSTINKLDQVTQQNAVVASEANHVANEVNKIAEKVVENTNKKEFHEEI
ncbi:methyl-accepting chemotaxis sensory transducer [Arcobacter nitrofigilis DSM 7299]|uniref:Methyl-accepting chemotaxis sensory transducer n=1 Tax=Arcobacter nitrofigilis (strain ATCC 33309 / DSM 7299 / CCUG 15893 / LMG 7604 / NCTC 12251 / CI) TaxID=572480 RepID=D5V1L3_ARCNC|nr:methyl-accepting chemotaxis protein [Arcobacter nitrofigilis]ADG93447.1 methyl-accepting chemotaxis sensory transducer [Arcobacter nitrofigilis DSM 7299]